MKKVDYSKNLLENLCNAYGVSGFENNVRKLLIEYWEEQHVKCEIDGIGNLLGKFSFHSNEKPTLLIMAHMDEIGLMVTKVDDDGFLKVLPLGGWLDTVVWNQKWIIQISDNKCIPAISGMDTPHILSKSSKKSFVNKDKLFLDAGMTKKELIDLGIRPGLPVVPDCKFQVLSKKKYLAKAFDDRVGLAVMVDVMKSINENASLTNDINVVFAATVQEELGLRGAQTIYESLKPDFVINIEMGIARDYPSQFALEKEPKLGEGPAVFVYDRTMIPNQHLIQTLEKTAKDSFIPFQWEAEISYGEDASCLQTCGKGVAAVNIGIPLRYAHGHVGIIDRRDYDNAVKLVSQAIPKISNL